MKKLILPLVLLIVILSSSDSFAQNSTDCWNTHMVRQYSVCTNAHTECLKSCSTLKTTEERKVCFADCGKAKDLCTNKAVADYKACVGSQKQAEKKEESSEEIPAQDRESIGCEQLRVILNSKECPYFSIDSGDVWCAQANEELTGGLDANGAIIKLYKNRSPDYIIDRSSDYFSEDLEVGKKCLEGAEKQEDNTQPDQAKSKQNDKKEPNDSFSFIPVFDLDLIPEFVGTTIIGFDVSTTPKQIKETTGINFQELSNRKPTISIEDEKKAWDFLPDRIVSDNEDITIMSSTSEMVQYRYTWSVDSGSVINAPQLTEIEFLKPVRDEKTQELKRMLKLDKGQVEIKVKNANQKEKFGVQTEFLDLIVIGTHFWVKNDPDKKYTLVMVYKGQVEIKTKDEKTATIIPDGDKPGMVVVSQKLSVMKLAFGGLILATIIGGVSLFLRGKIISKKFNKKRK